MCLGIQQLPITLTPNILTPALPGSRTLWYGACSGREDGERGTRLNSDDRRRAALTRSALVVVILCLLLATSSGGNHGGRSLAREGAATPATPATPVAIDFDQLVAQRPAEV